MALHGTLQCPPHLRQGCAKDAELVSDGAVLSPSVCALAQREMLWGIRQIEGLLLFTPVQSVAAGPTARGSREQKHLQKPPELWGGMP